MKLFQNKMTALRNVVVAATMIVATTTIRTFAHVSLVSAIPAENASILSQPKNLTLNFGAEVMLMNIKLLDAQRRDVPLKYKVTHDLKKSFDVALPKRKKGKYTVVWTTMGKDGHNMNGEYSFTIKSTK
jgi:methionine-rich copper-binding protein CopC